MKLRVIADWEIEYGDSERPSRLRLRLLKQINRGFLEVIRAEGGMVQGTVRVGVVEAAAPEGPPT